MNPFDTCTTCNPSFDSNDYECLQSEYEFADCNQNLSEVSNDLNYLLEEIEDLIADTEEDLFFDAIAEE